MECQISDDQILDLYEFGFEDKKNDAIVFKDIRIIAQLIFVLFFTILACFLKEYIIKMVKLIPNKIKQKIRNFKERNDI